MNIGSNYTTDSAPPVIEANGYNISQCNCAFCRFREYRIHGPMTSEPFQSNSVQPYPTNIPHFRRCQQWDTDSKKSADYPKWSPNVKHLYSGQPGLTNASPFAVAQQKHSAASEFTDYHQRQIANHSVGYQNKHPGLYDFVRNQQWHSDATGSTSNQQIFPESLPNSMTSIRRNANTIHFGWPSSGLSYQKQRQTVRDQVQRFHPYAPFNQYIRQPPSYEQSLEQINIKPMQNEESLINVVITKTEQVETITLD